MMGDMELPLVLFTVLAQAAIGLLMFSALRDRVTSEGSQKMIFNEQLAAMALIAVALLSSLTHLGHPFGAVRTLANLEHSWLSREILIFGLLFGALAVSVIVRLRGGNYRPLLIIAAVLGVIAVVVQGMTYAPPSETALANGVPMALFLVTAVILGAAFGSWFAADGLQPLLTGILAAALSFGLVLNLLLLSIWLSGGLVAEMTGLAYLESPLFWTRLVIGFVLPLAVLIRYRHIPGWLPILVLAGEVLGRIAFFGLAVSSANLIGMPL